MPLAYLLLVVAIAILLGSINFLHGFAEDNDGVFVVEKAMAFRDDGYQMSRTWGFPLYEVAIYPIISSFGVFYAKLWSLAFYAAASALFLLTLRRLTSDPLKAFLGTLCFVVLPVSIISGNSVLETSQGMFFSLLGLYSYVRFGGDRDTRYFFVMAAALGAATSTRPDYVFLSLAIALTILVFNRPNLKHLALGAFVWAVFALAPFLIYEQISLERDVVVADPLVRKVFRALLGYVALLGIPATICIAVLALTRFRRWPAFLRRALGDDIFVLFSVALALYTVRYMMLPDELEYVYVLVPLLIMAAIRLDVRRSVLVVLLVAVAVPNLVQVHVFSRDDRGNVAVDPGVSPGAVVQDRSRRLLLEYRMDELPELLDGVAARYGREEYARAPSEEPRELVIIPEESLRFYQPGRRGGEEYAVGCTQEIVVYPLPWSRGWRQLIEFTPWHRVGPGDFEEVTLPHCG